MPKPTTTNKEALISGALTVLNESHDVHGLTVDALASRLRMSKSTLYKHFGSKDGLIKEVVSF